MRIPAGPLRGAVVFTLIVLNTIACCLPLLMLALAKLALPVAGWRRLASRWLTAIAEVWIAVNTAILHATQEIRWETRGVADLPRREWYLVIANHRSWVDILALQAAFNRRIPFLKFFLKQQLIWVPALGLAWWALDMPFMKRYSATTLQRHPELRGRDLAVTRRACERFATIPTSVINFVEGTRFTPAKRAASHSPYRHLLAPRPGGVAFVLGAMGGILHALVDVTLAYPQGVGGFWDLCCGRVRHIIVDVQTRPIEPWLKTGDYGADPAFRARFRAWLGALWREKDERLAVLLDEVGQGEAGVSSAAGPCR